MNHFDIPFSSHVALKPKSDQGSLKLELKTHKLSHESHSTCDCKYESEMARLGLTTIQTQTEHAIELHHISNF